MSVKAMDFGGMQAMAKLAEHAVFSALVGQIGAEAAALVAWSCKTTALRALAERFPDPDASLFLELLDAEPDACDVFPDELAEEERLDAERLLEALEEGDTWD